MKNKKRLIIVTVLLVLLSIVGAAYYLVSVQMIFKPVEKRYADKKPNFVFSNTVAYVPVGKQKVFTVTATTDSPHPGTCTIVFTKGTEKRIEVRSGVSNDYHCTVTKPFSFFGVNGLWDIFILLKASDGGFATKTLENVEINSDYKPQELTFTSVDATYQKDENGDGIHTFVAHLSGNATGSCYFLFLPEIGRSTNQDYAVSKYVPVINSNTCSLVVSATEFESKGWQNYTVSFTEPYNRFHVKDYTGEEFIYH